MKKLVYVVDDDRIYQFAIKWHLQKRDSSLEVEQFMNAQSCLDELMRNKAQKDLLPHIILVDVNMPGIDGWGFLKKLELIEGLDTHAIDIYMVSSSIDRQDIEKSKNLKQVKNYIIKPVSDEDLNQILNQQATL